MARVILFNLSLINRTTSAFYFGVTLQHTTLSQSLAIATKACAISSLSITNPKADPSTKMD